MGAGKSIPGELQVCVLVVAVVSERVIEWRREEGESGGCPEEKRV